MFWASEQRLVEQANTIFRNSWITELEIEQPERNLTENDNKRKKKEVMMIQVATKKKKK